MATAGAALRLRLLSRMVRVGELLALAVLLFWSSSRVPSAAAAAAAVRLAGLLVFNPRFVFAVGNGIVLLLFVLSRRDPTLSPSQPAAASTEAGSTQTPATAPASAGLPSFATAAPSPTEEQPAAAAALPTPAVLATPTTVLEEEQPSVARIEKARAPRRSRSEKISARRAASPEMLRRSESDDGPRRRSSATARDLLEGCWAGMGDANEFQRTVEAFIAKQTRFHREEETMAVGYGHVAPAMGGALVTVE